MKVKFDVSPDTEISVDQDADGNVLSVIFSPMFASAGGTAVLAYGTATTDKGKTLDRFSLVASAATGKVTKKGRTKPARARVDDDEADDDESDNEKG